MAVNVERFKEKVTENGLKIPEIASFMGINVSTLYRKLNANGETFTVKEVRSIARKLNLNRFELMDIFFSEDVA